MNLAALLIPLVALLQPVQGTPASAPGSNVRVELYADHEAIQPGGQVELAAKIIIEPGWHMYHPITLGAGVPTTIDFDLPPGATVGEPHFPAPTLVEETGIEYLSLEDQPVVLTTLKLAADAPATPLKIVAHVRGEVCKKVCLRVDAQAALTLNVATTAAPAANAKLFEDAKAALPKPLAQAPHLEGSRVLASHKKIPVGGQGTLIAIIKVPPGHHAQDRNPGVEGLIPTRLFIESRDGIVFDREHELWPKPRVEVTPGVGKANVQAGVFTVRVPFVVEDRQFKPGPVSLGVLLQYQVCKDLGACFPPELAEGRVQFEVGPADAPAVPNDDPELAKLSATGGSGTTNGSVGAPGKPAQNVLLVFLFAFLGGAILNITPCVLPVISLKIFGFVQQARDEPGRVFRMGLVYAAGILACFAVLAVLMVTAGLAWGGLMQSAGFLIGMSGIVFAFALSLLGVFEIQLPGFAMSAAGEAASREGYGGAFLNGILAVLLATPCVAPLLGTAIGLLVQMPAATAATGIMLAGLGLAAPYVLLSAFPGWLRFLPKPGPWMVTFKQIVGFILVAVVLWLVYVLVDMSKLEAMSAGAGAKEAAAGKTFDNFVDTGLPRMFGTLGMLLAVGIGCWLVGKITLSDSNWRTVRLWSLGLLFAFGGGWLSFWIFNPAKSPIPWQHWEPGIAERLSAQGYTVYVDYTATWCWTCKTNKKVVLERKRVYTEMAKLGIYPIEADFTSYDPEMKKELAKYDKVGVPLNIILPAGKPDDAIVLPELLTTDIVLKALAKAGPSQKRPDFWPANE